MWIGTCAAYGFGFVCSISDHVGQRPDAAADDFLESYLMFPVGGHAFSQVSCRIIHSLPQCGWRDRSSHTFAFPCLIHLHVKTVPLISDQYQTAHWKKGWQTSPRESGMGTAIARMVSCKPDYKSCRNFFLSKCGKRLNMSKEEKMEGRTISCSWRSQRKAAGVQCLGAGNKIVKI